MVMYETLYGEDIIDTTISDQVMIGIGGTCTVRLHNGNTIDLVNTGINYKLRTLSGNSYRDSLIDENQLHQDRFSYGLDEISEVIFEGFIITPENRETILKLIHEKDGIKFTKIPRRD